ncbi:MAG: adenylyl-sulfate kinase [Thermoleophilaceae bacterium]
MLSPNVVWQPTEVDRTGRGLRGATVWFTGLPSSGKSTLAAAVEERLIGAGVPAYVLDGDNLRHGLNGDLGFDGEARAENVRRTAHVARLFADAGMVALVSLVSPYAADRELARRLHEEDELPFVEVFLNAPLAACEQRDPKGLYARARRGEISSFTGVDDPYEPPLHPEVEILPAPLEASVDAVIAALAERGLQIG